MAIKSQKPISNLDINHSFCLVILIAGSCLVLTLFLSNVQGSFAEEMTKSYKTKIREDTCLIIKVPAIKRNRTLLLIECKQGCRSSILLHINSWLRYEWNKE